MRCPGFDVDDYAFYALGTLEGDGGAAIDEHLAQGCETCKTGVSGAFDVWYGVALSTPEARPPMGLRRKVLAPFRESRPWWTRPLPGLVAAGAFALALILGWFVGRQTAPAPQIAYTPPQTGSVTVAPAPSAPAPAERSPAVSIVTKSVADPEQARTIESLTADLMHERERVRSLETDLGQKQNQLAAAQDTARAAEQRYRAAADQLSSNQDLVRNVADLRSRAAELERQVLQYRTLLETERKRVDSSTQLVAMLGDPAVRLVRLRSTEKGQTMEGHALIAGDSQMMFFGSQLPALPAGRTYQLWVLRSKGPAIVSAGTFNPNSGRQATLRFGDKTLLSNMTALAITDEPEGGSALPTGHKWMIGS